MAKETRQFDGVNKAEALTEVLKEFPASVMTDFEFDEDTQIATFNVRAIPVMARDPIEAAESATLNEEIEAWKTRSTELDEREIALNDRERALRELDKRTQERIKEAEKIEKQAQQSLDEIRKKTEGIWKRTKSFFHGIK